MGVIQYLRLWRLLRGREMLATERATVGRTARVVGYSSEFAFAKAFKRHFGYGPGEARASVPSSAGV